jgi:DNA-binding IclR family transcriptional regulator
VETVAVDNNAWASFKDYLASLRPGDVTTVEEAVRRTGMAPASVRAVLDALTRAELFEQHGTHFVRIEVHAA